MLDNEEFAQRQAALITAKDFVDPILEEYGLEDYQVGAVFAQPMRMTKVDQHIEHITRVADWLLKES